MRTFTDFWTYLYKDVFKEDQFRFMLRGTGLPMATIFWGLCGFLMLVDLTGRPKWILKFKVQPGVNQPAKLKDIWRVLKTVCVNQFFISYPYLVILYPIQKYRGCSCLPEDLPTVGVWLTHIVCMVMFEEIMFYYTHRLAHWGPLYRNIHKKHHEFTAPMGFVCVYSHPLEHLVCNVMPVTLGGVILGAHMVTIVTWYGLALFGTIVQHSGYHLLLYPSPKFHDYHHFRFVGNYGAIGILDRLHGTDAQFRLRNYFNRQKRARLRKLASADSKTPAQQAG